MAAQLNRTSGLSRRLDRVCSRLLNSSLPVPVSPAHQHRHVLVRQPHRRVHRPLQRRALADDAHPQRFLQAVLAGAQAQVARFERPLDAVADLVVVERFAEVVVGPALHRRHGGLLGPVGGQQQEGQGGVDGQHLVQQLQAAHARHGQVAHHHVDVVQAAERLLARLRRDGGVALRLQHLRECEQHPRIVVNQQNSAHEPVRRRWRRWWGDIRGAARWRLSRRPGCW